MQKNVLRDFMSITDDKILLAKAFHYAQENTATINMYMSIWSLFDKKSKTLIQSKAEQHARDGIALFYYTLCKCTGSAESSVCNKLQQLNNLPAKFKELQFNVVAFSNYVVNCIEEIEAAGGKDKQDPDKLIEALMTSPSAKFNSNIRSHCSTCRTNSIPLNIDTITDLARQTYQTIHLCKEWPTTPNPSNKDSEKKQKSLDNIATLIAKYDQLKLKYKHMCLESQSHHPCLLYTSDAADELD
eukprot:4160978-Ditylum_brightwellii.AAC.1